ncbi:FAD-dependent oxidoreductase [Chromobacterium sphagni]|uniref:FAD-dependent oxidoreductase n=1 Tax=Chromobacterium sphagni TaxID=1903179 RepID=A0A1S1X3E7_9NEIS|nr:D-arabinono-1,4-lactone oxidase [Chromobacterium sphagni]OHX14003.1 FAD-dependent oxidoreductase [Chromobacterium sphagni]
MKPLAMTRRRWLQLGSAAMLAGIAGRGGTQAAAGSASAYRWRSWTGINRCQALALEMPADEAELAALLRGNDAALRCVGSGHSFSPLVPTAGRLLSLDRMSGVVAQDRTALTATLLAGTRLAQLSRQLDGQGLALRNLPDVDVQTFAGAISTATHGTGARLQALHADVLALRLLTPAGEALEFSRDRDPELLQAARVSLGSLGVVTQATISVVPAYYLQRKVWLRPLAQLLEAAPELARQHRNFEFYYLPFTGYAAAITHDVRAGGAVSHPESNDEDMLRELRRLRDWLGRVPDLRRWVAQKLIDPAQTELALDKSWRLLSTARPTPFNESECHVPREAGIRCVREVIRKLEQRNEVFFPLEFRFVGADEAWLSPFYQRDSCSIAVHAAAGEAYDYLVSDIAPIFRKYQGRPHWGKLHAHRAIDFAALYPRWNDFLQLRRQFDPKGLLLNPHLRQVFGIRA